MANTKTFVGEIRFPGKAGAWTGEHRKWLNRIELDDPWMRTVLRDYLCAVEGLEQRRGALDLAIEELWSESPWAETIARLRCLRGVSTLTAFGLCAEEGWRLSSLQPSLQARALSRHRPARVLLRRGDQARSDHQGRLRPCSAPAGRGGS